MKFPSRVALMFDSKPTPSVGMACDKCREIVMTLPISNRISYHGCGSRLREMTVTESRELREHIRWAKLKNLTVVS